MMQTSRGANVVLAVPGAGALAHAQPSAVLVIAVLVVGALAVGAGAVRAGLAGPARVAAYVALGAIAYWALRAKAP